MMNPRWRRQPAKKLGSCITKSKFLDILNGLTAAKLDHYCGGFERQTRRVGLILTKLSFDTDLRSRCYDRFRQFADQVVIFIPLSRN